MGKDEKKESLIQTLEQRRASKAWDFVDEVNKKDNIKKKYRSLVLKTPVLILTNGLGQTIAFFKSKTKESKDGEHELLYGHLSNWLIDESKIYQSGNELIKQIIGGDSTKYRQATAESIAFLNWLKRFAEAVLPPEEGGNE